MKSEYPGGPSLGLSLVPASFSLSQSLFLILYFIVSLFSCIAGAASFLTLIFCPYTQVAAKRPSSTLSPRPESRTPCQGLVRKVRWRLVPATTEITALEVQMESTGSGVDARTTSTLELNLHELSLIPPSAVVTCDTL